MTSSCIFDSGSSKSPNFFVFSPISLKFDKGDNFLDSDYKNKPRLKVDNDLSQKLQFY